MAPPTVCFVCVNRCGDGEFNGVTMKNIFEFVFLSWHSNSSGQLERCYHILRVLLNGN